MHRRFVVLKARDINVFEQLFQSRIMTMYHIASQLYLRGQAAAKKRLQKLRQAGYVAERPRQITTPSKLYLTRKGFNLLQERGLLARYPHLSLKVFERRNRVSEFTERHELAVMDVKVALVTSLQPSFQCVEFSTWPRLHQFAVSHPRTRQRKIIAPDGFIHVINNESHHYFYLEVDRSTESLEAPLCT